MEYFPRHPVLIEHAELPNNVFLFNLIQYLESLGLETIHSPRNGKDVLIFSKQNPIWFYGETLAEKQSLMFGLVYPQSDHLIHMYSVIYHQGIAKVVTGDFARKTQDEPQPTIESTNLTIVLESGQSKLNEKFLGFDLRQHTLQHLETGLNFSLGSMRQDETCLVINLDETTTLVFGWKDRVNYTQLAQLFDRTPDKLASIHEEFPIAFYLVQNSFHP